jgi:hypothetical protein
MGQAGLPQPKNLETISWNKDSAANLGAGRRVEIAQANVYLLGEFCILYSIPLSTINLNGLAV